MSARTLPDFLIIGAQKCGTTWLHQWVRRHPDIYMPEGKDGGFYGYEKADMEAALDKYARQFADGRGYARVGESSAAYFWTRTGSAYDIRPERFTSDIPARVRWTLGPDARLILSLRDPVERAVSAYLHHIRHGDVRPDTSLMDAAGYVGLVDMGFYARHLGNWLRHFPLEQILVLILEEDIVPDPRASLRRVFRHLGVDEAGLPLDRAELPVYGGLPRRRDAQGIRVVLEGEERLAVSRETLHALGDIYREDVRALEEILGRPLLRAWRLGRAGDPGSNP
jgi:hypothetical protein